MESTLTRLEAQTKTSAVADALRRQILDGLLPPGTPLLQEQIARDLGVSPTPVREAFAVLEAEGLLQRRPHRGVIVALAQKVDAWDRKLTLDVRLLLERHAISRMVAQGDMEVISRLRKLIVRGEAAQKRSRTTELRHTISEFHRVLAYGLGSDLHIQILHQLSARTQFYPHALTQRQLRQALVFHADLVAALGARNESGALAIWDAHAKDNAKALDAPSIEGPSSDGSVVPSARRAGTVPADADAGIG